MNTEQTKKNIFTYEDFIINGRSFILCGNISTRKTQNMDSFHARFLDPILINYDKSKGHNNLDLEKHWQ